MPQRLRVLLGGAVQGVGFRPFVYRLATELLLTGFVENTTAGLHAEVEGEEQAVRGFLDRLMAEHPPAARILTREIAWLPPASFREFRIVESTAGGELTAAVLPDLAPCPECLSEIEDPVQRRHQYPFTNCTRCGPRFTILNDLPYDRPNTTMRGFELCADCRREYESPEDRRFHAQPIACPVCGPRLSATFDELAEALASGFTVALKAVGGYQLLADATNADAVALLRERKRREWKPFAVLMRDVETIAAYAEVSAAERELLESSAAPIVLLTARQQNDLAPNVCGPSPWLGAMLPASPLHHLICGHWPTPLVATSGNLSDEPIATDNAQARSHLSAVADLFFDHDRPVARPCDDSVARVVAGRTMLLRRARGYAPMPVPVRTSLPRVLAAGPHLKSTVAIGVGKQVVVSQHIGDLESPESRAAFESTVSDLRRLYRFEPEMVACDLHPDYFSTHWADAQGLPVHRIQHHHAHAAACLAENDARGPALAVVWDGTGYGTDGTIWGGEIFYVEDARYVRVTHLRQFPLAGGDAAALDCRRSAAGLLHRAGLPLPEGSQALKPVLDHGVGCVETSSAGRLFDAMGALTGLAAQNRFEGEAGLRLEAAAWRAPEEKPYAMGANGDWQPMVEQALGDLRSGVDPQRISARFHHALAAWIETVAVGSGLGQVALSGGCFQNAFLTQAVIARLEPRGIRVLTHQAVPPNDGGVSLGQVVLAATADYAPL